MRSRPECVNDDDIGTELQARVEAGLEGEREPLVVRELHDVVDAELPRDLDRAVGGAVVDDEPLDRVEPIDVARERPADELQRVRRVHLTVPDDRRERIGRFNALDAIDAATKIPVGWWSGSGAWAWSRTILGT